MDADYTQPNWQQASTLIDCKTYFVHEFNAESRENDIAVIKLAVEFNLNASWRSVLGFCPQSATNSKLEPATAIGLGLVSEEPPAIAEVLMETDLSFDNYCGNWDTINTAIDWRQISQFLGKND